MCCACHISNDGASRGSASSEEEQDTQEPREHLSVQERQEKLLDKLNLDGLSEWSPHNTAIVRELLLSYHDTFVLLSLMSLGVPVPSNMRSASMMMSPSRNILGAYHHPY